jgi:hypothetical protein
MTTINLQVSASADDCYETDDTNVNLSLASAFGGYIGGTVYDIGIRWQSVDIANATSITSATLSIYLTGDTGTIALNIRGIDEDNTATWSAGSRPSQRTKTTATIDAAAANWGNWGVNNWVTIDVKSAIQEIINRAGWAANNDLAVVIEDTAGAGTNYISCRMWNYAGNAHGPKLDIVYGGRTTKNSRQTMNSHAGTMFQVMTS